MQSKFSLKACALIALAAILFQAAACQSTVAALTSILGNAAASIATLEGNSSRATKLSADTAAATTAVNNWKSGTPAQNVVEALQLVQADLQLFPINTQYDAYITLALGTVVSIIEIVDPSVAPVTVTRDAKLDKYPKNTNDFKKQWNAIGKGGPKL